MVLTTEQNTREYIQRNLTYHHGGQSIFGHIVETLLKLPSEVAEFVLARCAFVSMTEEYLGSVLHARILRGADWVIFIGPGVSTGQAQSVVARQIAYAWLRYDNYGLLPSDHKSETHALIREWGFEDAESTV